MALANRHREHLEMHLNLAPIAQYEGVLVKQRERVRAALPEAVQRVLRIWQSG